MVLFFILFVRWVFFSYIENSILEIKCNFKSFNTESVLSNNYKFKAEIITSYNNTKEKNQK